ncbi:hypothetical protein BC941DRAFT_403012 [Chlamydoabsidia padenii]|nr:hypothetical protein BC941DRAFT_403012 [Chlamydoabsidia padenii]
MSNKQVCVITNVDSHVGYALAYRFLEENKEKNNRGGNENQCSFRLLCRNMEGLDPLVQLGGEIHQVDYNQGDRVRELFKNVHAAIFIPEHDHQRVEQGENVIKAAKSEKVNFMAMISCLGVERVEERNSGGQQYIHLKQYRQLEERLKEAMGGDKERLSIIRLSVPTQFFYFMAPSLEDRNVLPLSISKDRKWSTVDLNDVVDAMVKLSDENQGSTQGLTSALGNLLFGGHQKQEVYRFTPRQWLNMEDLTQQISQGLQMENIKYEKTDSHQLKAMLQELRNDQRFKQRPGQHQSTSGGHRQDTPFTFPLGRYLNDSYIETLIEVWDLVNEGKFDKTTDDLKQILGREPMDVQSFFKNNRQRFQDLR